MNQEFIKFLAENYFIPIYFLALTVSIIYYRSYFDTPLKYFPAIIAYTFFNELLGCLLRNYSDFSFFNDLKYSSYNDIIYNIFSIIYFGFFYRVFWKLVSNKKYKKWIFNISMTVMAVYLLSCFWQNPTNTNLFYAHALGSWALLFCIGLYFLEKKQNKEKIIQPSNLVFWISLGLIVFYSLFPILFLIGYLDVDTWEKYELRAVLRVLIVIMYTLIITGFIKGRRRFFG